MLSIYDEDRQALNQCYIEENAPQNTLAAFIRNVISNMYEAKNQYPAYTNPYFSILARFAGLGVEAKEFLFRSKMVARCLQFLFAPSPFKYLEEDSADVAPAPEWEEPEIGMPIEAVLGYFDNKKFRATHDRAAQQQTLIELLGILLNSM